MVALGRTGAIAGFDCRIDEDGNSHPWRMIAWKPTREGYAVLRRLGSLPEGKRWLSIPRDPLYGDLQSLGSPPLDMQGSGIVSELASIDVLELLVMDVGSARTLFADLASRGILIRQMEEHREIMRSNGEDVVETQEFPGDAGREIAAIRIMTGVKA